MYPTFDKTIFDAQFLTNEELIVFKGEIPTIELV